MMSAKIVKGDTVVVLVGKDKGKTGEVSKVFPKTGRATISGINMAIKHLKQSEKNAGGRIPQEASIHLSNLAIWDSKAKQATRVGFKIIDGKKVRFSKKSGELING